MAAATTTAATTAVSAATTAVNTVITVAAAITATAVVAATVIITVTVMRAREGSGREWCESLRSARAKALQRETMNGAVEPRDLNHVTRGHNTAPSGQGLELPPKNKGI